MSNKLEKPRIIDPAALNGEFYFASLIEQAAIHEMLSATDIQRLQYDCLALLAKQTEKFCGGHSSSVPVERAQSLMTSLLFTVSLALKEAVHPDEAVNALSLYPIESFYQKGLLRIRKLISATKTIHAALQKELIQTENTCYRDTLVDGINGFFKCYDPDFGAHEIHITADYPLAVPLPPLAGIEFIKAYVTAACYENKFCSFFDTDTLHHLFCGYTKDYAAQMINLYEPVFHTAVGCVLCGTKIQSLNVSAGGAAYLEKLFRSTPEAAVYELLTEALHVILQSFNCSDGLQHYLKRTIPMTENGIRASIKADSLRHFFPLPDYGHEKPQLLITYGTQMDNEAYRMLLQKIGDSEDPDDRLQLVYTHIHSLADLETLLLDADLEDEEVLHLFGNLSLPEAAALIRHYRPILEEDAYGLLDSEMRLRGLLQNYLNRLPPDHLKWLEYAEKHLKET